MDQSAQTLEELERALSPGASAAARLAGLERLGLTWTTIAEALGISVQALQKQRRGTRPRAATATVLDNLRLVALTLLTVRPPSEVCAWLQSRRSTARIETRPYRLIAHDPERVHAAVEAELLGDAATADEFLIDAGNTIEARTVAPVGARDSPLAFASSRS